VIKTLTYARTFTVTFLSPVHISTEERLDEHDFVYENGQLVRFRVTPILEQMDDEQLSQFVENGLEAVMDWLRQTELWQRAKVYQSPVTRQPNWRSEPIRPFIADPLLRPYLPGTEIKGAIRTAVAWWLLRQKNLAALRQKLLQRLPQHQPSRRELVQAGQWLEQSLFGSDPNHDILRSLRVQDSTPVEPERLKVFLVIVAVRTNKGLQWLQSPRGGERRSRYTDDHRQAVANFCECLDGSVSGVKLTVVSDTFLSDGEIERGEVKLSVPEERWFIADYKMASWTQTQQNLLPLYEAQLNAYAYLAQQLQKKAVIGLALIYFEPEHNIPNASQLLQRTGGQMMLGFKCIVVPVPLKPTIWVRHLCWRVFQILSSPSPPTGKQNCQGCQALASWWGGIKNHLP